MARDKVCNEEGERGAEERGGASEGQLEALHEWRRPFGIVVEKF